MARSHNPQEQFEELKRKNRNRLIGATAFVTLGAGVLISALNHQQESSNEIVRVDMPGTPTVLSKAPEVQTEILQPALPQVAQETTPAPTETAKNIPETVQAKKLEKPVTPKIEPKTETKKTEKPVVTKTETKKAEKPVATKTETKKTDNKKLSPQEILNGKAGKTVTANKTSTIQIGAFSSSQQAETQKAKLAQIGVNAKVHQAQSANGTVYRVRVQAASSAESERIVKRLKDNGFDSISVHQ
ncbi:MAG: SPOR domain-containing protein [Neisseriaceae bacterium]|nr:SPOR domain-containing protein [Neisseriaceae bacterium]